MIFCNPRPQTTKTFIVLLQTNQYLIPLLFIPNPSSQILNYNPATDFSIKQEIGRGSFSIIYKASSRKTGEDLALKRMHPRTQKEKNVFLNEINITFQCNHPNIIQYHSAYDYEGHLYVFEELMSTSLLKIL